MFKTGAFFALLKENKCLAKQIMGPGSHMTLSYAFASNQLKKFEKEGLIILDKKGRKNTIVFTEKGKKLQHHLFNILTILDGIEDV
jgi:predicted transcriptional regulator